MFGTGTAEGLSRLTGVPRTIEHFSEGIGDVRSPRKRTTSQDRVFERETPTEELGVGQPRRATRITLEKMALLREWASNRGPAVIINGESSTRDGSDEGSQGRD
jgi:hypothetical protein